MSMPHIRSLQNAARTARARCAGVYARLTIRQKLFSGMALTTLAAIVIIGVSSYKNAARITDSEWMTVMKAALAGVANDLNHRLEMAADVAERVAWSPDVRTILSKSGEDYPFSEQLEDFRTLERIVAVSSHDMYLFIENASMYSRERTHFFPMDELRATDIYSEFAASNASKHWGRMQLKKLNPTIEYAAFVCLCNIRDEDNVFKSVGVVAVPIPEGEITALFDAVALTRSTCIYLADTQNNVLARGGAAGDDGDAVFYGAQDAGFRVLESPISATGWSVFALIPNGDLREPLSQVMGFYIALSASVVIAVWMLSLAVSAGITKRISSLAHLMRGQGASEDAQFSPVDSEDEIGVLQRTYNDMLRDRKQLVEQLYIGRLRERDAQLKALESQINPHFLYNTLDTMNWMALEAGAVEVSEMIGALARFFRLSLRASDKPVTVREDLEHAALYLELQKRRMGDSLSYAINVPDELMEANMLRLTLQPLVENAIKHGIGQKPSQSGVIRISGRAEAECVCLAVEDDGPGVARPEDLPDGIGQGSYGVRLTDERIQLAYGEDFGLGFDQSPLGGLRVTIRLPKPGHTAP